MKRLLISALFFLLTPYLFGQATIAKLKYQDAEEAFANGDYTTAVTKLKEAEKLLGQTNAKIMYLLIQAESKLVEAAPTPDMEMVAAVKQHMATYLKKYENADNIEDKYRDVYKLSEAFQKYPVTMDDINGVQKGNPDAILRLANYHLSAGNHNKAWELAGKLVALNNKHGLLLAGYLHDYGYGAAQDYVKAMEYYSKASLQNMPVADFYISWLYLNGQGVEKDSLKAAAIFLKALPGVEALAAQKNVSGLRAAGSAYMYGMHIQPDYAKALQYNAAAMESGDVDAMYQLSLQYSEGWGVAADPAKAWEYLMMAANRNMTTAMEIVAAAYARSSDKTKNPSEAIKWYTKAAEKGSEDAMYALSDLYMAGFNVANPLAAAVGSASLMLNGNRQMPEAFTKSAEWCEKAAAKGHTEAMFKMSTFYLAGLGVARDENKGKALLKKAADKKHADAAYTYANYCYKGIIMEKNYPEALTYFTISAEGGNVMAMESLATMYEKGQGIPKDKVLAKQWEDKARAGKKKTGKTQNAVMLGGLM